MRFWPLLRLRCTSGKGVVDLEWISNSTFGAVNLPRPPSVGDVPKRMAGKA
jgi:hypothetical protein